ncbi:MAG: MerR family transcriptional regulator [Clostridiales bacterium]
MRDVRNCKSCGKMYTYVSSVICDDCVKKEKDDFKKVKEYLYDNPKSSMTEVSQALEISTKKLTRYLREGRLEIDSADSNMFLGCQSCGKSIKSGRYCDECEKNLKSSLSGAVSETKQKLYNESKEKSKAIGMRYLNKKDK